MTLRRKPLPVDTRLQAESGRKPTPARLKPDACFRPVLAVSADLDLDQYPALL
jgi:hypothetical protein